MENASQAKLALRVEAYRIAAENIRALAQAAESARDFAVSAIRNACETRLALGMELIKCREQFAGDFDEWLEGYCSEYFSRATAYRWMAKVRDLKIALGKEEPTFEELKRAQLAAETLPEPWNDNSQGKREAPLFQIRFSLNGPPPEQWTPLARQEFLIEAEKVVTLYMKVKAIEEAA